MPKFAANLTMLFNEVDFLERFAATARAGFQAVEYLFPYAYPKDRLAELLSTHGLVQVLHNLPPGDWAAGERGIGCHPDRVGEFQDGVGKAIEYATALGCKRLNCLAGIAPAGTANVRLFALLVDENPATVYFDDLQALLGGDFDGDLDIDAADLAVWKGAFGQTAAGDADGDADSDGNDFLIWQRGLGSTPPVAQVGAVPEPGSAGLAGAAMAMLASAARCGRRRN